VNQYLYRVHPARDGFLTSPTPHEVSSVEAHFRYLAELTRRGVVLLAGRTLNEDASTFGIVVFEALSDVEARAIMQADPAVTAGTFIAKLYPYQIALASPRLLDLAPRLAGGPPHDEGTLST
jgi:hypothetical protein